MADAGDLRLRLENDAPARPARAYVLYWMTDARRTRWNRALSRAVGLARSMGRPLLVFEAIRCDARYACARFHRFLLDGMADNATRFDAAGVAYYPYAEPVPGAGKGLLEALAQDACVVVTDAAAAFFLPRMRAAAAKRLDVRLEAVDGTGLLPRAAIKETIDDPFAFLRRFRQTLPKLVFQGAVPEPLAEPIRRRLERLPKDVADRWHPTRKALLDGDAEPLKRFPIDGSVGPSSLRGGEAAARALWAVALRGPERAFAPEVEPYVHFGHLSTEEMAQDLLLRAGRIASIDLKTADESPDGWWRTSPDVDRFLDRLVVRREHAHHRAERRGRDGDRYDQLPGDVRRILEAEAGRPGRVVAGLAALEAGEGPDPDWNALAKRLRTEGRLPPGTRRRWAGGLLEAAASPRDAFDLAAHLTHKYALDGRDPFALAELTSVFRPTPAPAPKGSGPGRGGRDARNGPKGPNRPAKSGRHRGSRGKGDRAGPSGPPPTGPAPQPPSGPPSP